MRFSSNRCSAFTLIEVIVALTVLGVGLVATIGALQAASRGAHHAEYLRHASLLAEQKLNEFLLEPLTVIGEEDGEFAPPDNRFRWMLLTRPSPDDRLVEVLVTVRWTEQGTEQAFELATLRERRPVGEAVR